MKKLILGLIGIIFFIPLFVNAHYCGTIEYKGKIVSKCDIGIATEYILGFLPGWMSWVTFYGAIAFFILIIFTYFNDKKRFKLKNKKK